MLVPDCQVTAIGYHVSVLAVHLSAAARGRGGTGLLVHAFMISRQDIYRTAVRAYTFVGMPPGPRLSRCNCCGVSGGINWLASVRSQLVIKDDQRRRITPAATERGRGELLDSWRHWS